MQREWLEHYTLEINLMSLTSVLQEALDYLELDHTQMNYTSLVYFHILLSLSCVAASVANLAAICDLSIVVAFGHNELWRPKAAERVSL